MTVASPAETAARSVNGSGHRSNLTVSVIVLTPVEAIDPEFAHVTTWPTAPQLQPEPLPDTKLKPAGNVSVTVIAPVVEVLPMLVTTSE